MFFELDDGTLINLDYVTAIIPEKEDNHAGVAFHDQSVAHITRADFDKLCGALRKHKAIIR